MTLARRLLSLFEAVHSVEVIPNTYAVARLKSYYLSGKNKDNVHARFVDTSRGDDYVLLVLDFRTLERANQHSAGAIDRTVNIDYAKTLINSAAKLPPLLVNARLKVVDGGHRFYAMYHAGLNRIPVLMRQSDYEKAKSASLL